MGGSRLTATSHFPYRELFEACFPVYLSFGMTYEQYWQGDCTLVRAYRKAEALRVQRANQMAWLEGRYFYEALCDASPLLHAFAKEGTEAYPYRDAPIPVTRDEVENWRARQIEKQKEEFRAFADAMNAQRKKRPKGGEQDAE